MRARSGRLRFLAEVWGLSPLPTRLRQARVALQGEEDVPPAKYGLSSLSQYRPSVGPKLWAGRFVVPRTALVTNLFNHTQTPIDEGWSVRKTQVRDFRGRRLTYDSHNGTDFSVPVGTTIVAAAPGVVARVASEFNRGGLKLYIDHGGGLMTCTAHLARPLVKVGERVGRGQPVARSGYSGLDGVITFPWGTPHIHFNVWLHGRPVDPFPHDDQPSMWRTGPLPVPVVRQAPPDDLAPSVFDPAAVDEGIAACVTASARERLRAHTSLADRGTALVHEMNYYPTRFEHFVQPYAETTARHRILDLPVSADEVDGVTFVDDLV